MTKVPELVAMLRNHDWTYENSDDSRMYKKGKKEKKAIVAALTKSNSLQERGGTAEQLYNNCRAHQDVLWDIITENEERETMGIKMRREGQEVIIGLDTLKPFWAKRASRVEKLRETIHPGHVWGISWYRWLVIDSIADEGVTMHKLSFDKRGWEQLTYKQQRVFLECTAERMQARGWTTDLNHCTLTCYKEA